MSAKHEQCPRRSSFVLLSYTYRYGRLSYLTTALQGNDRRDIDFEVSIEFRVDWDWLS